MNNHNTNNIQKVYDDNNKASPVLIAESNQMKNILKIIKKVGKVPTTVLITGESGVGKEQVANAIYHFSS